MWSKQFDFLKAFVYIETSAKYACRPTIYFKAMGRYRICPSGIPKELKVAPKIPKIARMKIRLIAWCTGDSGDWTPFKTLSSLTLTLLLKSSRVFYPREV